MDYSLGVRFSCERWSHRQSLVGGKAVATNGDEHILPAHVYQSGKNWRIDVEWLLLSRSFLQVVNRTLA